METITLRVFFHKGMDCIGIFSDNNTSLNDIIQKKAGGKWSRTNKCWYVPCKEMNYDKLARAMYGKATLITGELKKYLLARAFFKFSSHRQLPDTHQRGE